MIHAHIGEGVKEMPMPKYHKCNAGHELVYMWNENRQRYVWDCPTCIAKMEKARAKDWQRKTKKLQYMGR